MIHALGGMSAALLAAIAIFLSGPVHAVEGDGAGQCIGFQIAQVEGLADYHLTSCCRKGCGGNCCRCGTGAGYLSDCSTPCAVGRTDELQKLKAVPLPNGLVVVGKLIHPETKAPIPNEKVQVLLPGGKVVNGKSGQDGTFRIEVPGRSKEVARPTQVGDVPFVPTRELEKGEVKAYQLFLVPKSISKATS
jgi:hypothetical protein